MWRPWSKRNESANPRVHAELTPRARSRLYELLKHICGQQSCSRAIDEFAVEHGSAPPMFNTYSDKYKAFKQFTLVADNDELIDLVELMIREYFPKLEWKVSASMYCKLNRILVEEGILLKLNPSPEEVIELLEAQPPSPKPKFPGDIRFTKIADSTIEDSDATTQRLTRSGWEDELNGYNEAWDMYNNGVFSYVIAEKLYNSLEAVTTRVCEARTSEEFAEETLGTCIETLQELGFFKPSPSMRGEIENITRGLKLAIQKSGGDRKRHVRFEQRYCVLLLHQVSAFLNYVIQTHEELPLE